MPKKLTQEQFIDKANNIHDFKYDYSKVEYRNNYTKVIIKNSLLEIKKSRKLNYKHIKLWSE